MGDVNWLMVVTAAILIVAGMLGYINGLIKTILNLVLGVVTLVLVLIFSPRVCTYLQTETELPAYVNAKVEEVVLEKTEQMLQEKPDLAWEQSDFVEQLSEALPFLPALKDTILENEQIGAAETQGVEQVVSHVSRAISERIVILIGYVSTFLVVFFALRVMAFLLNIVERLPLIHEINKFTGLIFGLVEGLLVVWIFGMILSVMGTTQLGQSAAQCIAESSFLQIVYGYNLLQQIIFWIIG